VVQHAGNFHARLDHSNIQFLEDGWSSVGEGREASFLKKRSKKLGADIDSRKGY